MQAIPGDAMSIGRLVHSIPGVTISKQRAMRQAPGDAMSTLWSNAKLCAQAVYKVSSWCFHTCPMSTAAAWEQRRCMWSVLARWWMSSAPSSAQRNSPSMVTTSGKPCTAALHTGLMALSAPALKPYCLMVVSAVDVRPSFSHLPVKTCPSGNQFRCPVSCTVFVHWTSSLLQFGSHPEYSCESYKDDCQADSYGAKCWLSMSWQGFKLVRPARTTHLLL